MNLTTFLDTLCARLGLSDDADFDDMIAALDRLIAMTEKPAESIRVPVTSCNICPFRNDYNRCHLPAHAHYDEDGKVPASVRSATTPDGQTWLRAIPDPSTIPEWCPLHAMSATVYIRETL